MSSVIIAIICVLLGVFLFNTTIAFRKKNLLIFKQLESIPNIRLSTIWVSTTFKLPPSYHGRYLQVILLPNGILLMTDYVIDLRFDNKEVVDTILLTTKGKQPPINKSLVKQYGEIESIKISEKGEVEVITYLATQSRFEFIGYFPKENFQTKFTLNTSFITDTEFKLKQMGII